MPHHKISRNHRAGRRWPGVSARRAAFLGAAIALVNLIGLAAVAAPQETVLYRFKGGADGYGPFHGLIMDAKGALYGTTFGGGSGGNGTVFELMPPPGAGETRWTENVLYRFKGNPDGSLPGGLMMDAKGALYGMTFGGGRGGCDGGCGTVFELRPPLAGETRWTEKVLYRFQGNPDGAGPGAGVIMDAKGALYGTTSGGGGSGPCGKGCGTVFELTPPAPGTGIWTERVLHSFTGGADGAGPQAGLIMDENGALYGTTVVGGGRGCRGCGTVFALKPPAAGETRWTENVLYGFKGGADGAQPLAGLILDANGAFYGTTAVGGGRSCDGGDFCGTVFELIKPTAGEARWTEKVLYRFKGSPDGFNPEAGLIMDAKGALYGTTPNGGGGCQTCGHGTVFELMPPAPGKTGWTETVTYRFRGGADGAGPMGGLIMDPNGTLYGTTLDGGACRSIRFGCGTVFKLVP